MPSYLGFSYLGQGVSLHSCSGKVQPLLLTLDEGYLLTPAVPDLPRGMAPLDPPVPMQPLLLGCGVAHSKSINNFLGFPGGNSGKEPSCQCRRQKKCGFDPCVEKVPWRKPWQATAVFLPGESQWQSSVHEVTKHQARLKWRDLCTWNYIVVDILKLFSSKQKSQIIIFYKLKLIITLSQ